MDDWKELTKEAILFYVSDLKKQLRTARSTADAVARDTDLFSFGLDTNYSILKMPYGEPQKTEDKCPSPAEELRARGKAARAKLRRRKK